MTHKTFYRAAFWTNSTRPDSLASLVSWTVSSILLLLLVVICSHHEIIEPQALSPKLIFDIKVANSFYYLLQMGLRHAASDLSYLKICFFPSHFAFVTRFTRRLFVSQIWNSLTVNANCLCEMRSKIGVWFRMHRPMWHTLKDCLQQSTALHKWHRHWPNFALFWYDQFHLIWAVLQFAFLPDLLHSL